MIQQTVYQAEAADTVPTLPKKPRVAHAAQTAFDLKIQQAIRPKFLDDYCGQEALKQSLRLSLQAAKERGEPVEHMLFYGPPGLGKTTMATIIANEMGVPCHLTSAPSIERPRDVIGILMALEPGSVVFIDEIHRLNTLAEELLYPAMEDFTIDRTIGKGNTTRLLQVPLPKFTLVGATTKAGSISGPLRDRFGHVYRLHFYTPPELVHVLVRAAQVWQISLSSEAALAIAMRARGTPRIANRLLRRVRDVAQIRNTVIDAALVDEALALLGIDLRGLDDMDRLLLRTMQQQFSGGPVGLETLASAVGEDIRTLEDVVEPYLLQCGLIQRTPRGRQLTAIALEHLACE